MEFIISAICITIVMTIAMLLKMKVSYKGINIEPGLKKSHKESARISFNDVYSDIESETKAVDAKIKSLCKSTFIDCYQKYHSIDYNEVLNSLELKRYTLLLRVSSDEVVRPGLRKKVFRNSFPDQSSAEDFNRVADHKTKEVADTAHEFITSEWTLDFSRDIITSTMAKDKFNSKLYEIIRQYYLNCIRIKEASAKALEMQYNKQGLTAEHFLDEFKCFYDALPQR